MSREESSATSSPPLLVPHARLRRAAGRVRSPVSGTRVQPSVNSPALRGSVAKLLCVLCGCYNQRSLVMRTRTRAKTRPAVA